MLLALAGSAALVAGVVSWSTTFLPRRGEAQQADNAGDSDTEAAAWRATSSAWQPPLPTKRCPWVEETMSEREVHKTAEEVQEQRATFSADANTFYRATDSIFWRDFVEHGWGLFDLALLGIEAKTHDGMPQERTSTWTWTMGDQHLSNFGAWRNRHNEVNFGVNDFDESTIYDFQMDVWRLSVSIYNHAVTNGFNASAAAGVVRSFTDAYVHTIVSYIDNEDALLFELTPKTTKGTLLGSFLDQVQNGRGDKMLNKFTEVDNSVGERRFLKNDKTRLEVLPQEVEAAVRAEFSSTGYGATLQKIGWHIMGHYDPEYFRVLDVAARVNSGVGSMGVARYYVLLAGRERGEDSVEDEDQATPGGIILDVKEAPRCVGRHVLDHEDAAWYDATFRNEAARAVEAQRRLTSFTDPFTGWVVIDGVAHTVRQRSPWKTAFDLSKLKSHKDIHEFAAQVAVVTATSHTRGTVGKSPGQFKQVIASVLGGSRARKAWGDSVAMVARHYRQQVLLDFECYRAYAQQNGSATAEPGPER